MAAEAILRSSPDDWVFLPIAVIIVCVSVASRYRRFFVQWLDEIRGKDWQVTSAVIDVVSAVVQTEQTRYGERIIGYLGTLTYFYKNPELQMGEFSRMFDTEGEANEWTASLKGVNVMVHVDPRSNPLRVTQGRPGSGNAGGDAAFLTSS
jgi:hypothetical protein